MPWRSSKVFALDFASYGVHDKSTKRNVVENGHISVDRSIIEGRNNKRRIEAHRITSDEKAVDSSNSMESGKASNKDSKGRSNQHDITDRERDNIIRSTERFIQRVVTTTKKLSKRRLGS